MRIVWILMMAWPLAAADWLMLQGTQPKSGHHLWGFIQVLGEKNYGDTVEKNGFDQTSFSRIPPTLETQQTVQIQRLRIGARGSLDDTNLWNYFLLTDFGENGITYPLGVAQYNYLTDASITAKHLPVFVRAGRFKYPGSEEGMMARFADAFIRFTTVTDQLMLERFTTETTSLPAMGVGAFRDTGVQFFKTLGAEKQLSVAYMAGMGLGMSSQNIHDGALTHYGYVAYAHPTGTAKGYDQEGLKLYAWAQTGKRLLEGVFYDRTRFGVGTTWVSPTWRIEAEAMGGSGMIFTGAKDMNALPLIETWQWSVASAASNRAYGGYLTAHYCATPALKFLARYDTYHRLPDSATNYRVFDTVTIGATFALDSVQRVDLNYAFRNISAPQNGVADTLFDAVGPILGLQYVMVIK